ncbi:hypothetical protein GCM10009677_31610 [Sphaerisporangium rubeum]
MRPAFGSRVTAGAGSREGAGRVAAGPAGALDAVEDRFDDTSWGTRRVPAGGRSPSGKLNTDISDMESKVRK